MTKKEQVLSKNEKKATTSPQAKSAKAASPDKLVEAGKAELANADLDRVSGGCATGKHFS